MELKRYHTYSRKDLHALSGLESKFSEGAGKWGLQGIVRVPETKADFVFFVTLGTKEGEHSFKEGITEEGILTWQSQPKQRFVHPMIKNFITHDENVSSIYLLFRSKKTEKYTYLGDLKYFSHNPNLEQPVHFEWKILDWEIRPDLFKGIGLDLHDSSGNLIDISTYVHEPKENELLHLAAKPKTKQKRAVSTSNRTSKIDHIEKASSSKKIGDAGELLVYRQEVDKLLRLKIDKKVVHVSMNDDNAGYDILSYNENGDPMYIEVKTTITGINTSFYISANEVKVSEENPEKFYIYRVYELDEERNCGKLYIQKGPLSDSYELESKVYLAHFKGDEKEDNGSMRSD